MLELAGIIIFPSASIVNPVKPSLSNNVIITLEPTVIGLPFKVSGPTPLFGKIFPIVPPISLAIIVSSSAIINPSTVMDIVAESQFVGKANSQI